MAVVNSRFLGFLFLNLIQCLCGNPPLVVGVPRTKHFIARRCDHTFHSLPPYVEGFLFHQLLQDLELIGECDADYTRLLVSFRRKVLYPKRWFVLSVQFFLKLSFNRATRRWWAEARSAPRLTRTS